MRPILTVHQVRNRFRMEEIRLYDSPFKVTVAVVMF